MTAADAGLPVGPQRVPAEPVTAEHADLADAELADEPHERADARAFRLSSADFLTLGNALCGFLAIYYVATSAIQQLMRGEPLMADRRSFATAVVLLMLAATFDLFDGVVARRFRASRMGAELDNLADVISFGLAPAFMVAAWGAFSPEHPHAITLFAAGAVLASGVVRLARFAVTPTKCAGFQGLPIPMAAMTVVSIVLLDPPYAPAIIGIVAVAWMMVSRIEYPKPSGKLLVLVLVWIIANVGCLSVWALNLPGGEVLMRTGATLQIALAAGIPLRMVKARRDVRKAATASPREHG